METVELQQQIIVLGVGYQRERMESNLLISTGWGRSKLSKRLPETFTFKWRLLTLCWKQCGKTWKCWLPAFSHFPIIVSPLSKIYCTISPTMELSSAYAFNLDKVKIYLSGNGLICHLQINCFVSQWIPGLDLCMKTFPSPYWNSILN